MLHEGTSLVEIAPSSQYATFEVNGSLYGIDVTRVQEIVNPMPSTRVPLAKTFVKGLMNLRGQVATEIGLRELFGMAKKVDGAHMNVVCRDSAELIALQVDVIGDVIEVNNSEFEKVPATVPQQVRTFMKGVYKLNGKLLSVLDIEKIFGALNE